MLIFYYQSKPAQGRGKKGLDVEVGCEEDHTSVPELQADDKQLEDASIPEIQPHEHVVSACLF